MKKTLGIIRRKYANSRLKKCVDFSIKLFKLDGNSYMPPALAFYIITSCIPLISIVFMILSFYSKNSIDAVYAFIVELGIFTDEENIKVILEYLQNIRISDYIALITSIIASIYIASRGVECFSRFSDHFYDRQILDHHMMRRKFRSIIITLILVVGISGTVIITVAFNGLMSNLLSKTLASLLKYVIAFIIIMTTLVLLFKFSPTQKMTIREILPGAYISSLAIVLTVVGYSVYANYSVDHYNSVYGPLSSIIILLLLCYFISYIVFIGFYLNILLKSHSNSRLLTTIKMHKPKVIFVAKKDEDKNMKKD